MKKLIFMLLLILTTFAMTKTVFSVGNTNEKKSKIEREYLDLSVDPVDPNGISDKEIIDLINDGWKKGTLKEDAYSSGVQFKDVSGNFYYKAGWLKSGTVLYYKANDNGGGSIILKYCKNRETDWRTLSKIYK